MYFSFVFVCLTVLFGQLDASAIPMWEFLNREEKTSFLYSMFANQVEAFCEPSRIANCNQELLKFGLNKLKSIPEEYLDAMDPYQRDANKIIWESLMQGHPLAKTALKPQPTTTTAKPNSYEDESFGYLDFGSQSAASARIDNVYRVPPPKGFVLHMESGTPLYTYPHNYVSYINSFNPPERKGFYNKFQGTTTTEKNQPFEEEEVPLTGPMVVRVYPDGTPVEENQPIPQDEDLRQYKLSKVKIPNF